MRRLDLYLRARKPINNFLIAAILPIILVLLSLLIQSAISFQGSEILAGIVVGIMQKYKVAIIIYMFLFLLLTYYLYLDDILMIRTNRYRGYVSFASKSRTFEVGGRNPSFEEKNKLNSIKRLEIAIRRNQASKNFDKTFHCFYKKLWSMFEVDKYVDVLYLQGSRIVIDVKQIDENSEYENILPKQTGLIQKSKGAFVGTIIRGVIFSGLICLIYVVLLSISSTIK